MKNNDMTLDEEMCVLEGDLCFLMNLQNQQESTVDNFGYPLSNHLSAEIGRLEKIWGQLHEKCFNARQ